jgi:hypothetical protein
VCSLSYPACKAHAPYYIAICHLSGSGNFSALSHKRHNFRKKKVNMKWVMWFSLRSLSETFPILRWNERDMIKNVYFLYVKCPLFLSDFNGTNNFLERFSKCARIPNFMKVRPVWSKLFRADGQTHTHRQTDKKTLIVAFRNFTKAPKNGAILIWQLTTGRLTEHFH